MDAKALQLCEMLVPASYVRQGGQALSAHRKKIRALLQHVWYNIPMR